MDTLRGIQDRTLLPDRAMVQIAKGSITKTISATRHKPWLALFRFYGPEKPPFDKTWKLPDIEEAR